MALAVAAGEGAGKGSMPLSRDYVCREGAPVLNRVDRAIFRYTYFARCMDCGFCHDWCCSHGVDVDVPKMQAILAMRDGLADVVATPVEHWFEPELRTDAEFPGGQFTRTRQVHGRCVFLNRTGRGCSLHKFALDKGINYHQVKPFMSSLFPLTFDGGLLTVAEEIAMRTLVCRDQGSSCYAGVRSELEYYFGASLVAELDRMADRVVIA